MAVGLQEGLLGQVLRVVLVADPVVGVGVDVLEVVAVERFEGAVELRLGGRVEAGRLDVLLGGAHARSLEAAWRGGCESRRLLARPLDQAQAGDPGLGVDLAADQRRKPVQRLGRAARRGEGRRQQRHRVEALGGLADQGRDLSRRRPPPEQLAGPPVAARGGELLGRGTPAAEIPALIGQASEGLDAVPLLATAFAAAGSPAEALDGLAALVRGEIDAEAWVAGLRLVERSRKEAA